MLKRFLQISGFVLLIIFIVGTLAFTLHELDEVGCSAVSIEFEDDDIIQLQSGELEKLVLKVYPDLFSNQLGQVNSDSLEKAIEKHPVIEGVEAYKVLVKDTSAYTGILTLRVKHRRPVVRIVPDLGEGYYLDIEGRKIPVSTAYSAHVITVTGNINTSYAEKSLLPFIRHLVNDEFWSSQIVQGHVNDSEELLLSPLVGDHLIELGSIENFETKLRNLKAFYKQVLAEDSWNMYSRISLKFEDQIIAKRK